MAPKFPTERVRPFRLVKYFTFSSLIVILIGALALSLINTYWARSMLLEKNKEYANYLIASLNEQVFLQFMIPVVAMTGEIQLSNENQMELMDQVVRGALHGFRVDTVNIYDMNSVLSYSYNKDLIGKKNIGGAAYHKALQGESTSRLIQRGNSLAVRLGIPVESKIETFAPLRAPKTFSKILAGEVRGVVEIVQDLSEDYRAIIRVQTRIVVTSIVVMALFFLTLRFLVKRGETMIEKRAQERLELIEQLNRAERLSSLGEMVAGISHEIRNPLGIIRSSAELLMKKRASSDPDSSIPQIIVEEATRLNGIITDFLNYSRPRTPDLMPCHVVAILEKNIALLKPQIDQQGYTIRRAYQENIPEIMADADMLYQAFLNIVMNAMQSMPEGGEITVAISTNGDSVTMVWEDAGEGVPEDVLEKVWDPFVTTKEKGTGLGLGIVKNIIEAHGGGVGIGNRDVGGTSVSVTLPVKQGE